MCKLQRLVLRLRGVDPDEFEEELARMDRAKETRDAERREAECKAEEKMRRADRVGIDVIRRRPHGRD